MKQRYRYIHKLVHAVHFGAVGGLVSMITVAVLGITLLSPAWIQHSSASVSPFPAYTFWNTPVPSYTNIDASSSRFAASISQQVGQFGVSFDTARSAPVYQVGGDIAPVSVQYWDCGSGTPSDVVGQWQNVPIPFNAVPGGEGSRMVIQSAGDIWEFGGVRNNAGQWEACRGGKIASSGNGVFGGSYGLSTSGLAAIGGQLTADELRSGYIDHVVGLALPRVGGYVAPASRGMQQQVGAPPLGTRLKLDPSVNVTQLGLSPAGVAIARAAQTYGFIVWDTAPSVSVLGNNPITQTSRGLPNPYSSVNGASTALNGFPWDKLQVLPSSSDYTTVVPAITSFTSSQMSVRAETTVTLSWQAANLNRCSINGVSDNLPASGSVVTKPLLASTLFVLRCGGQNGAASSQLSVLVTRGSTNSPQAELPPGVIIDQPYSGYANILPEIMNGPLADRVYKVVYFQKSNYLYETAKPPYALNTARMDNGKQTVEAQIYYRDGTSEKRSLGIAVNNSPETLFATTQSNLVKVPTTIPPVVALISLLLVTVAMSFGIWWGWHKAHMA